MKSRSYTVVYEPAQGGGYYAHIPALGITTEGRTSAEARIMARDAIEGFIEAARELKQKLPKDVKVTRVRVSA